MAASLFTRYLWLTDVIYSAGRITRSEIDRRWAYSSHNPDHSPYIPERTFHRWRIGVEETFGLDICCDKRNGSVYYIRNVEEIKHSKTFQWMLNTFAVTNIVNEAKDVKDNILLEQMPSDARFLMPVVDALRNRHVISMTYRRFDAPDAHTFLLEPYCVKAFKQRWYVLGKSSAHDGELRVYALDRVQDVQILERKYSIPRRFDAKLYFYNFYGVFTNGPKAEKVVIRVVPAAADYLRSLPLHHSQKETATTPEFSQFEFFISPTYDFILELRTHGANLKVLKPEWLARQMQDEAEQILKLYTSPES